MTDKTAFTPEEWKTVLAAPPSAGAIVVMASRGGMFRETAAMAKAYAEARSQHGASQLLDEIAAAKPHTDHTRYHSYEELTDHGLSVLRDAVSLLANKATPEEVEDYRRFVVTLATKVASAHEEHGQQVNAAEAAAIRQIAGALGTSAPVDDGGL